MDETSRKLLSCHKTPKWRSLPLWCMFGTCVLLIGFLLITFGTAASASARATSPVSSSSTFPIPPGPTPVGWHTVQYGQVELAVPASWPVYDLSAHPERCVLFNTNAVYLGQQGPAAQCPARAVGKSEALQLEPLATDSAVVREATLATTVAGISANVSPSSDVSHTFLVVLSQSQVVLNLSYGRSAKLASQILGTLHVTTQGGTSGTPTPTSTPISTSTSTPTIAPSPAHRGHSTIAPAVEASGVFTGSGFDACAAPSTGTMSAWLSSPYRAVGIYIGGANRACGDGYLSNSWVNNVTGQGWNLMPIYVGLQAPCSTVGATIDPNQAAVQGSQAADDAVSRAQYFGLGTSTILFNDMEAYNNSLSGCSQAVMTFLSAWTQELHARNYLSGVYSSTGSGITDLVNYIGRIQEPDTIWFARYDGIATTSDPAIPGGDWVNHQRIKQYQGGHNETWGGATINIDNDYLDAVLHSASGGSHHIAGMSSFGPSTYQLHSDGSIWVYQGPPLTGWQELDKNPATTAMAEDGNGNLYQLHNDGTIWVYQGTPLTGWLKVDNNPAAVAIATDGKGTLYQLHNDGTIWVYQGTPLTGWQELDKNPAAVAIATDNSGNLYQLHNDGTIWQYQGTPLTGWLELDKNPATVAIVANGNGALYQLHNDGTIWVYQGTPLTGWQELDKNPATTAMAADASGHLYQLHNDGTIWIYQGTPLTGWLKVDNNPAAVEIAANGNGALYQLHNDGTIWQYQGTPLTGWLELDKNPAAVSLSGAY